MSEHDRIFVDTNVWLYAFIAAQDGPKHLRAQQIIGREAVVVSVQVVNEVCRNLLRKAAYSEQRVRNLIASYYSKCQVVAVDQGILARASDLRGRYGFSFWDSLLIATAVDQRIATFYSEDMHHGLVVDGVTRIVNPFAISPASPP